MTDDFHQSGQTAHHHLLPMKRVNCLKAVGDPPPLSAGRMYDKQVVYDCVVEAGALRALTEVIEAPLAIGKRPTKAV
ncbi:MULTISPECIES: hypothetical protein [unclassified Sphingomonas]|uniref:hypothetical protein n=1 Tax=unclassified Sphingomonas TaxID=196159 RepID=UPI00128FCC2E|nr:MULTISPECIES: hypothetical protein [unclassified Sphingomonas]